MKTSTIVLSVAAVLGSAGALAAWHHMPCTSCSVASAAPAAAITTVANPAPAPAEEAKAFTVDAVHSAVVYRIKHMGVSYFYGRFNEFSGAFHFDSADAAKSSLNVTVKTDSIDSANDGRDKHLKSADFFSASEYPEITFAAKSIKKTGDSTYEVTGDLSLLGKTKSVTTTVTHVGTGKGMRGGELSGIETTFTIKRSDFGMTYGIDNGALGDEVQLTVSLEGARK